MDTPSPSIRVTTANSDLNNTINNPSSANHLELNVNDKRRLSAVSTASGIPLNFNKSSSASSVSSNYFISTSVSQPTTPATPPLGSHLSIKSSGARSNKRDKSSVKTNAPSDKESIISSADSSSICDPDLFKRVDELAETDV